MFFSLGEDEKIRVPFIVAAELAVSEDSRKLLEASKAISSKFLVNNETDLDYISKTPTKTKKQLKANDCLLIALCERYNADLMTFDKALKTNFSINQIKKYRKKWKIPFKY